MALTKNKAKDAEAALSEVRAENAVLQANYELVQESLADLQLKVDDIGWRPLGEVEDATSIDRSVVYGVAKVTRALAVVNPLIVRGLAVRTAYIFGAGIDFKGADAEGDFFSRPNVVKWLCSDTAYAEMQRAVDTDGNFFVLCSRKTRRGRPKAGAKPGPVLDVQRIPLQQIVSAVTNPDNDEDIFFYRREWETKVTNSEGLTEAKKNVVYYPSVDYDADAYGRPASIGKHKIDWTSAIAHHAPNKQVGWRWGAPILWGAIFWSKAHKEFLETQLQLVKAYARFAFKVTTQNANQTKAVAQKVGQSPSGNAVTGNPNDVGGLFAATSGVNLSAVGKPGGAVDFSAGHPLANYVAALLSVPMAELLADASNANRASAETLDKSTEKIMKAQQGGWKYFFESIFKWFGLDVECEFPAITEDLVYRQIQAIVQSGALHVLSDKELRKLLIKAFDLDPEEADPETVPTEDDVKNQLLTSAAKDPAAAGGPGGKPDYANASYGDNQNRKDMGQHAYTHGKDG